MVLGSRPFPQVPTASPTSSLALSSGLMTAEPSWLDPVQKCCLSNGMISWILDKDHMFDHQLDILGVYHILMIIILSAGYFTHLRNVCLSIYAKNQATQSTQKNFYEYMSIATSKPTTKTEKKQHPSRMMSLLDIFYLFEGYVLYAS